MIWDDLKTVNDLMEDDLSKKIFAERVHWYFHEEGYHSENIAYEQYQKSQIVGFNRTPKDCRIAICGAGKLGRESLKAFCHAGYEVICFIDNDKNKQGSCVEGVSVISPTEFVSKYGNTSDINVVIDNRRLADVFFSEMYELGVSQDRIFMTNDDIVRSSFGNIYFDLHEFKHDPQEVFIDAGGFDGETTKRFIEWCGGQYESIYAFEPMTDAYELMKNRLKDIPNVNLYKCALGSGKEEKCFAQTYCGIMGSHLGKNGDYVERVKVESIDDILCGKKATFIKMDIEGAELEALKGSIKTLRKYRPKLALSLYHKNEDLYTIPLWLKENIPDYKFYLRHYSNKRWDLVLYAVV